MLDSKRLYQGVTRQARQAAVFVESVPADLWQGWSVLPQGVAFESSVVLADGRYVEIFVIDYEVGSLGEGASQRFGYVAYDLLTGRRIGQGASPVTAAVQAAQYILQLGAEAYLRHLAIFIQHSGLSPVMAFRTPERGEGSVSDVA